MQIQMTLPIEGERPSLQEQAAAYFDRNEPFLKGIERAAGVMQHRIGKVSARGIMEFARWYRRLGDDGMREMLDCFSGVFRIEGEDVAAVPNAYSAYITRYLGDRGYDVARSRSVMDDA